MYEADTGSREGNATGSGRKEQLADRTPSRHRRLLRNFAIGYVSLGISLAASVVLTPILLVHLGPSGYGTWVVIGLVGSYLGIFDSGVATAAVQQIAKARALGDEKRVADVVATVRRFFAVTGLVAVVLSVVLGFVLFGSIIGVPEGQVDVARLSLFLAGATTAIGFVNSTYSSVIFASGRSDLQHIVGTGVMVLTQIGQIIAVLAGGGYVALFCTSLMGALAALMLNFAVATRRQLVPPIKGHWRRPLLRELLTQGRRNMTITISGVMSYGLDAIVLGIVRPIGQVVPYSIGGQTSNFVRNASTAATNLLAPEYASDDAVNDSEGQFRMFVRAIHLAMTITSSMVIAMIVFGHGILALWLGNTPRSTYSVVVAINLVFLAQLPGAQAIGFLMSTARTRTVARFALPLASFNLILSGFGAYLLGPIGPVLASAPQTVLVDFVLLPFLCCRELGVPYRRYVSDVLGPLLVPCLLAGCTALLLTLIVGTSGPVSGSLAAAGTVAVALLTMVVVRSRKDPLVGAAIARLISGVRALVIR